jgi:hypothetical protein
MYILDSFMNIVDKAISTVTSKSSKAKGTPLIPEESPKRNSSMATPASTNPPSFSNEMYDPYTREPSPVSGSYSQAALQHTTTILTPHHEINAYPNFQNTNYASTPHAASGNYTSSNTYHLQTAQAQVSDSYPAEQLSTTDVFYTYEESYKNSFTMLEYPSEAGDPADQYQPQSPQLQTWAEETSNTNLPVNERLVRSNWE